MRCAVSLLVFLAVSGGVILSQPSDPVKLLASGFRFPEGPSVDRDGNVYLVNLANGIINRVTPAGDVSVYVDTGGSNQACLFDREGDLYICHNEPGRTGILKVDPARKISVVTTTSDGKPIRSTNDLVFGPQGRLYFTAPDSDIIHPSGAVHYIDRDGATHVFASGLVFANGLAVSPDGAYLYVGEERSARNLGSLWRFKLNPDGSAEKAGKELVYQLSGQWGLDGMKFDEQGYLWIAMYSEASLWRLSPDGKKIATIPIPGRHPTNLIFAGPDWRTAYVTVEDGDRNGKLFSVRMPFAGAHAH
jgi:gluconolactonase